MTSEILVSPVRVQARLDAPLNRWLWLVKWLLVIPHVIVLSLLWVATVVLSVVAFFAILFSGRYPRSIFDFNLGVLRWTWRVAYYAYGALATDRYPPFSLEEHPEYPATLEITYPAHLSRGLVLVKWLLALPHLLLVSIFIGGGTYLATSAAPLAFSTSGGLVGLLVLFVAIALLFTGRYPPGLFDLVLGLDRWVVRVAAYVGLMTDSYPPFRLDAGGAEPTVAILGAPTPIGAEKGPQPSGWSAGKIVAVVAGALVVLSGLGSAAGGAALLIAANVSRGADGLLTTPTERFHSDGYAIESGSVDITWIDGAWAPDANWLGQVEVRADSTSTDAPLFIGIADRSAVAGYLGSVRTDRVANVNLFPFSAQYTSLPGQAPATPPAAQPFWAASTSGVGPQILTWQSEPGQWALVVMNADGSPVVTADLSLAADVPVLAPIGWTLIGIGVVLTLLGTVVIVIAVRAAQPRGTRPELEQPMAPVG